MKKSKRIIKAAACLALTVLVLWAAIFFTDFICVSKVRDPIFAKLTNNSGNPLYKGPGYTVEVKRHGYMGPVEQITMYSVCGKVLNAVIVCHSFS